MSSDGNGDLTGKELKQAIRDWNPPEENLHPEDECECGDYRRSHDDTGCRVCKNSCAPYDGCTKFKLARKYARYRESR
jgi:hypothetical protein